MLANLRMALAARRLRQVDLAEALKVSPGVVSEIINARREPTPELRERISAILQADQAWLFSRSVAIPGPVSAVEVPCGQA